MLMVPTLGQGSRLQLQSRLRHLQHPGKRSRAEGWPHSIPDPTSQVQAFLCSSGGSRAEDWPHSTPDPISQVQVFLCLSGGSRAKDWPRSIPDPTSQVQVFLCSSQGRRNELHLEGPYFSHTSDWGHWVLNIPFWTSLLPKAELFSTWLSDTEVVFWIYLYMVCQRLHRKAAAVQGLEPLVSCSLYWSVNNCVILPPQQVLFKSYSHRKREELYCIIKYTTNRVAQI